MTDQDLAEAEPPLPKLVKKPGDTGLAALCAIAGFYRIAARLEVLARELALQGLAGNSEIIRSARTIGLKAKVATISNERRLKTLPTPAIACLVDGSFAIFAGAAGDSGFRIINPISFEAREVSGEDLLEQCAGRIMLIQRQIGGPGVDAVVFGFKWFVPSLWRYRKALGHVLLASLFVQLFALVTPLFFQVVVDKVLAHRSYSTLIVLVVGLAAIGLFDVVLQYLRTYALTTPRIASMSSSAGVCFGTCSTCL